MFIKVTRAFKNLDHFHYSRVNVALDLSHWCAKTATSVLLPLKLSIQYCMIKISPLQSFMVSKNFESSLLSALRHRIIDLKYFEKNIVCL